MRLGRKRKSPGDKDSDSPNTSSRHVQQDANGAWFASYVREFALSTLELEQNGFPTEPFAPREQGSATPAICAHVMASACDEGAEESALDFKSSGESCRPIAWLLAIDCEMCLAGEKKQLARVGVVDESSRTLLDEIIIPQDTVTDHLTAYSGITPAMLASASTTADAVRTRLSEIINEVPETYLVGHSLENDLAALGIAHTRVLDTSILYPLRHNLEGPPVKSSLRALSVRFLKRAIQQSDGGHCPCEDAAAAMDLVLLKLRRGLHFGLPGGADDDCEFADLFGALGRAGWQCSAIDSEVERLQLLNAPAETMRVHVRSDAAGLQYAETQLQDDRRFAWVPLRDVFVAHASGSRSAHADSLAALNSSIARLMSRLPRNTLLTLVGCGSVRENDAQFQAPAAGLSCVAFAISNGKREGTADRATPSLPENATPPHGVEKSADSAAAASSEAGLS
mgnify:CR=1 FL=1